jgi:hypothetical protein
MSFEEGCVVRQRAAGDVCMGRWNLKRGRVGSPFLLLYGSVDDMSISSLPKGTLKLAALLCCCTVLHDPY